MNEKTLLTHDLTASGVAKLFGVAESTVHRWMRTGLLPSARDADGRLVVCPAGLVPFLEERGIRPPPGLWDWAEEASPSEEAGN